MQEVDVKSLFVKFLVILCLIGSLSAQAATLSVMRDGSGDFTRIQPALDACASGDTILIGPGEYSEFGQYQWEGYNYDVDVNAFIDVDDLTIIGAGADQSVIGPRVYYDGEGYSPQVMVMVVGGRLVLRGVTLRNGVSGLTADRIEIDVADCRFEENIYGIAWYGTGAGSIENCSFQASLWGNPYGIDARGQGGGALISHCEFVGCRIEDYYHGDLHISNCNFSESPGGISVGNSPAYRCFVDNCQMDNSEWCIWVNQGGGYCSVQDSELLADGVCVDVQPYSRFESSNTIFSGGAYGFILVNSMPISVVECHIFCDEGLTEYTECSLSDLVMHDFRQNYWGTDDPAEIEASILDSNDDPNNNCTVLFDPYSDVPVPTESVTLDGLKALYR